MSREPSWVHIIYKDKTINGMDLQRKFEKDFQEGFPIGAQHLGTCQHLSLALHACESIAKSQWTKRIFQRCIMNTPASTYHVASKKGTNGMALKDKTLRSQCSASGWLTDGVDRRASKTKSVTRGGKRNREFHLPSDSKHGNSNFQFRSSRFSFVTALIAVAAAAEGLCVTFSPNVESAHSCYCLLFFWEEPSSDNNIGIGQTKTLCIKESSLASSQ